MDILTSLMGFELVGQLSTLCFQRESPHRSSLRLNGTPHIGCATMKRRLLDPKAMYRFWISDDGAECNQNPVQRMDHDDWICERSVHSSSNEHKQDWLSMQER